MCHASWFMWQSACIASLVHQLLFGLSVCRANFESATPAQCHSMVTFISNTMWQGGKGVTKIVASFGEQVSILRRLSTSAAKDEIRADSLHVFCANLGLLVRASLNKSRQFRCGNKNLQEMDGRESETWKGNVQNHHSLSGWVVVFKCKFSQEYILVADHHAVLTRSGAPFTDAFPIYMTKWAITWSNGPSQGAQKKHREMPSCIRLCLCLRQNAGRFVQFLGSSHVCRALGNA